MSAPTIKLTALQAEHVDWALDPMQEYWGGWGGFPTRDGEIFSDAGNPELAIPEGATMPVLNGCVLTLSNWSEINEDLLYRVGEMLPDMISDNTEFSQQTINGQRKSCFDLVAKINAVQP